MRKMIFFWRSLFFCWPPWPRPFPARTFENKANGVSLWLPDDWEIDNDEVQAACNADAPEEDAFCVLQVLVNDDDLTAALSTYGDALSEEMDTFRRDRKNASAR